MKLKLVVQWVGKSGVGSNGSLRGAFSFIKFKVNQFMSWSRVYRAFSMVGKAVPIWPENWHNHSSWSSFNWLCWGRELFSWNRCRLWTCATNHFSVPHHRYVLTPSFTSTISGNNNDEFYSYQIWIVWRNNEESMHIWPRHSEMGSDIISNMTRSHGIIYLETTNDAPNVIPDYRKCN